MMKSAYVIAAALVAAALVALPSMSQVRASAPVLGAKGDRPMPVQSGPPLRRANGRILKPLACAIRASRSVRHARSGWSLPIGCRNRPQPVPSQPHIAERLAEPRSISTRGRTDGSASQDRRPIQ